MNITAKYPVQNSIAVKNNNKTLEKNNSGLSSQTNNVSFKGGIPNFLRPTAYKKVSLVGEIKDAISEAAMILGYDEGKLMKMAQGRTVASMEFFSDMVVRYNSRNWGKSATERENPEVVIDLFKRIKQPTRRHMAFIDCVHTGMTDIKKCFDICEDDPKKLAKLQGVYCKLNSINKSGTIFPQIIESPNVKEYVDNIDNYMQHFSILDDTKGVIAGIDKQIKSNNVDLVTGMAKSDIDKMFTCLPKTEAFTKEMLITDYLPEKVDILSTLNIKFGLTKDSIEAGDAAGLKRIYKSTTKDNYEFRSDFIDKNYMNFTTRKNLNENEVNELAALFEIADKMPEVKKFLSAIKPDGMGLMASDYMNMIERLGPEYLAQNTEKVEQYARENRKQTNKAIAEIIQSEESPVNRMFAPVKKFFGRKPIKGTSLSGVVQIDSIQPFCKEPQRIPAKYKGLSVKPEAFVQEETPVKTKRVHVFKPYVPKQPNAKKLLVINDVNSIIEKKLGSKVLSEQASIYADKATKIRLGLLPEIFESIKETRAADRSRGIFSKSKSVSNSDAVDLYTRINGKNKKLVNYLLKVRNEDGTRKFNVKDIIEVLTDANREIIQGQNKSTKLYKFTSKDERAIYDRMFDEKFALYGKLPRKTSKKS